MQTPGAPFATGASCAPEAQACQARLVRQMRRGLHIRQVCHVLHPRQVRHVRGARRVCQVRQYTWQHACGNMSTHYHYCQKPMRHGSGVVGMVNGACTHKHCAWVDDRDVGPARTTQYANAPIVPVNECKIIAECPRVVQGFTTTCILRWLLTGVVGLRTLGSMVTPPPFLVQNNAVSGGTRT